jgi:hypothetical protein
MLTPTPDAGVAAEARREPPREGGRLGKSQQIGQFSDGPVMLDQVLGPLLDPDAFEDLRKAPPVLHQVTLQGAEIQSKVLGDDLDGASARRHEQ